jgi:hypothetical protein
MLEALEDRLVPAGTFTWVGGTSGTWEDMRNWTRPPNTNRWPGQNAVLDDVVHFDNAAMADATLTSTISLATLQLQTNFTKGLTITGTVLTGPNTITITHATGSDRNEFLLQNGTLTLTNFQGFFTSSNLALNGLQNALWTGGTIVGRSGDNISPGSIYVYNQTSLTDPTSFTINTDARNLGATLEIGWSPTGAPSSGTVNVATPTSGLSGNLTLTGNAQINVHTLGVLNLNQPGESDTKGGIASGPGPNRQITNEGTITHDAVDPAGKYLQISPKVINKPGATLTLARGTFTQFVGGLDIQGGRYLRIGAKVKAVEQMENGEMDAGADTLLDGSLTATGGTIVFQDQFGLFHVTGNLDLESGATLWLKVDGSVNGLTDLVQVDGLATINSASLEVTTLNASPAAGYVYHFLTTNGFSGPGWNSTIIYDPNSPFTASYYFLDPFDLGVAGAAGSPRRR